MTMPGRRLLAGAAALGMAAAGAPALHVTTAAAASPQCQTPQITGLGAPHGPASGTLVIDGSNFGRSQANAIAPICGNTVTVTVGGHAVGLSGNNGSQISVANHGVVDGAVQVVTTDNKGNSYASNSNSYFVTDPSLSGTVASNPGPQDALAVSGGNLDLGGTGQPWWGGAEAIWSSTPSRCADSVTGVSGGAITLSPLGSYCQGALTLVVRAYTDASHQTIYDLPWLSGGSVTVHGSVGGLSATHVTAGQSITVSGSALGSSGTATVGGVAVQPQSWSDTSVTLPVGDSSQGGDVALTRGDGTTYDAGSFTVDARVDSVSPAQAVEGDTVTLTGAGFGRDAGALSLNGHGIAPASWSATSITFTLPAGARPGPLLMSPADTNPPVQSPQLGVIARLAGVSPTQAAPGDYVQVSGAGFGPDRGTVTINGAAATVSVWADAQVVVIVPAGLSPGDDTLTITPPGLAPLSTGLSVIAAPVSASPVPNTGGTPAASASAPASAGAPTGQPLPTSSGGLILPNPGGAPTIVTGPVPFTKPSRPQAPVNLTLQSAGDSADPGQNVPFEATLIAFGKPVVGAKVRITIVVEPGADASVSPADAVTDAQGKVHGTVHLSRTPGDTIVLAQSGSTSDEIRVTGRGADQAAVNRTTTTSSVITSGPPRMIIVVALVACLALFLTGFSIQMFLPARGRAAQAAAGGAPGQRRRAAAAAPRSTVGERMLRCGDAAAAVLQFGVVVMVAVPASLVGRLRRR